MSKQFSIAMGTYNGARHLREQLNSIAAQTRLPDELVICDDGSTDATQDLINDFAASVPFSVNFQINERNLGTIKNFERAIGLCTGDYVALTDQDDLWLPDKLAQMEAEFKRAPNVGLIFSNAEIIDERGHSAGHSLWEALPLRPAELRQLRSSGAIDVLLPGSLVTGATLAFRARFKELVLPIPNDLPIIHDAWLALLIAAVSDVLPLPEPLIKYRQHSGQQVGALPRRVPKPSTGSAVASVLDAIERENPYADMIAVAVRVRDRLFEKRKEFDGRQAVARLEARIKHLGARANLPRSKLMRASMVAREILTLRYHRYSKGLASAAKDLLGKRNERTAK